jgi:hypothetical protein
MKSGKPLFDPRSDPFATYRILGGALAVAVIWFSVDQLWRNWENPVSHDFIAFWGATKLAIAGKAALAYDPAVLRNVQTAFATFPEGQSLPFAYTPAFLLLVLPFGLIQYPAAIIAWVCLMAILYLWALRGLVPKAGMLALAFPPVFVNCVEGQNGFLTAALFFAAIAWLQRRPLVAGVLIGCLIFKPQLGLLFPLALLAGRHWRAIAGATMSSIAITLAGAIAFGPTAFLAWLQVLPHFASIAKDGTVGWVHLTSIYAAGRQAGLAVEPALMLHMAVFAFAAIQVWRVWRSSGDVLAKGAVLACATMLSSSYLFLYDQLVLVIAFFWLATRRANPIVLATLWCLPIVSLFQYAAFKHTGVAGPINLGPLVPVALLLMVRRQVKAGHPAELPLVGTEIAASKA